LGLFGEVSDAPLVGMHVIEALTYLLDKRYFLPIVDDEIESSLCKPLVAFTV
jgi:hypothetical protein